MSVPITPAGNQEARQQAPPSDVQTEELGEGHIMGNLTADPELKFTPTGRAVAKLRVAWTPRIKNAQTGGWIDGPTEFYDVDVWGKQGERCAELLLRGDRIVATGTWTKRTWTGKEGEERQAHSLTARDIGPSLLFRGALIKRHPETDSGGGNDQG